MIATSPSDISPVRRFFNLIRQEKVDVTNLFFFAVMIGLVNLALPLGIQAIIGLMSGGLLLESVFVLMALVILATLLGGWLQIKQLGIVEIMQQRVFVKTAFDFADRIPKLKTETLGYHYPPELMNRFFEVLNIQKSLPKILIDFSAAIIQIIFGLLLLSFYHAYFIIFGLLLICVIFLVFYFTSGKGLETSMAESKYKYKVLFWLEELGRSVQSFKLAGDTSLPLGKTDQLLDKYVHYRQKHFSILVKQYATIVGFKTLITAGLLILGGALVFQAQINLGQFVASEIIIVLVINAVEKLIGSISIVYDLLTALDKLGHVTDLPLESHEGRPISVLHLDKDFTLETVDLSYKFPDAREYSFQNVNLKIHKGEKICLTGYNDAGKTSLVKTLAGLFHDFEGVIKLNGMSVREIEIQGYRSLIGDNLNLSDVFEGTIEENITMGRGGIEVKDVLDACKKAGLEGFVSGLTEGLQTMVQPSGSNFPGNVVKKILLARSYVQKPLLIIIDELFHNVQSAEKMAMLDSLFAGDYAALIVTSVEDVMNRCDRIMVMKSGQIIDTGTFEELNNRGSLPKTS